MFNLKFRDFIAEQKEHHGVFAFGRMNPVHSGHEEVIKKVKEVAKKTGGSAHVVVSHSHDSDKNPLTPEQKVKHAKRAFPGVNISASSKEAPNFLAHAARLHKSGVTHLHMIAGQDRVGEYHKLLHKYNGKKGPHGHFKFKHIEVHSAGDRDPDSDDVKGMSASKMREHAKNGNFKEFHKGVPSGMSHEHAKEMYHDVRKGMNVKESVNEEFEALLSEGVHDAGIFKAVFLAGGPGSGKDFVLKKTLHGHGLTEINSDKAFEHLMEKEKLDKRMPDAEEKQRNIIRARAKSVTELKEKLAIHGRNGLIINGTGDDPEKIKKIKERLESLGYETKFLHVHVDDHVSRERNIQRGMQGGREVKEEVRKQKWEGSQKSRPHYKKMFGNDYIEFNNNEDLRNSPEERVASKQKELNDIFKHYHKFTRSPVKNDIAKKWIQQQLLSKDKTKLQQKLPHKDSEAGKQATKAGLQYYGSGRYGQNKKVTHVAVHDKLTPLKESYMSDNSSFQLLCLGKVDESNLVNILHHPDHGKAYIWRKAPHDYDIEYTRTGKRENHRGKSAQDLVSDLHDKGFKGINEEIENLLGEMNAQETQGLISEEARTTGRNEETGKKEAIKEERKKITLQSLRKKIKEDFGSSTDEYITPALGATGEVRDKLTGKAKAFKEEKKKKNGAV